MTTRETQHRIKQAAIRLFNQYGTNKVSTNTIAEHCEISKGNLHYHFKNKKEIIQAIYTDIAAEIECSWYGDEKQPTVTHMAEMFVRQLDLIWRYRFFYREMVSLIHDDPVLRMTVREKREKRIEEVIRFFEGLVDADVLVKPRSTESLHYLVIMTWIFSDNWLNYSELQASEEDSEVVQLGYDFLIEMLYPYLTEKAKTEIYESYAAINRGIKTGDKVE
ncbi:MAG: TetR/AcrR family transcriptional regulator [Gammaproteobacteria bacterium]